MREVGQVHLVPLVPPDPAEDGEVGDRQLAGEVLVRGQAPVHHAVQAPRLVHEALQPVGALGFVLQRDEVVHLPGIGPKPPIWNISHSSTAMRATGSAGQNLPLFSPR